MIHVAIRQTLAVSVLAAASLLLYFVQLLYSVAGFESIVRMLPRLW